MPLLPHHRAAPYLFALLATGACGGDALHSERDASVGSAIPPGLDGALAFSDAAASSAEAGADAALFGERDAGPGGAGPGDAGIPTDGASPADAAPPVAVPSIDCGFSGWGTPFTWTPTSVSMSVLQTQPNSPVESYIGSPEVIDRGDVWDMFYAMSDAAKVGRIGQATSTDRGRTWKRTGALLAPYGSYASGFLDTPTALFEDGRYRVYLFGNSKANVAANPNFSPPGGQIGEVGLSGTSWSYPTPELALPVGARDAWDGLWVESPVVKRVGDTYFMWYTANDQSWTVRHGVATSPDGKAWQKFAGNPAVSPSTDNARFDSFFPGGPAVVQAPDGTFLMFFGCASRNSAVLPPLVGNICLATSPAGDGKTFRKYPSDAAPAPIIDRAYFAGLAEGSLRIVNGPINPSVVLDREQGVFKLYYENQSSYVGLLTLPVCHGM